LLFAPVPFCILHFPFDFGLPIAEQTAQQRTKMLFAVRCSLFWVASCACDSSISCTSPFPKQPASKNKNRQNHHDSDSDSMAKPSSVILRPLENENKNFIVKAKETKFGCRPRRRHRRQLVFVLRPSSFVLLGNSLLSCLVPSDLHLLLQQRQQSVEQRQSRE
jgi:hypothetical protein